MRRQQRYRSRKEWKRIIADWKRSGLTGPEFSRRHGLNHRSLYRWSTRLRPGKQHQESMATESSPGAQVSSKKALLSTTALRIVPVPRHLIPSVEESPQQRKSPSISLVIDRRFRVVVPDGFSSTTLGKLLRTLETLR